MAPSKKSYPVCQGCGKYTCSDCGEGFPGREVYLRHRAEAHALAGHGEPEGAPA